MCPSPNVWYWALITAFLEQEYQVYVGSSHHLWFCACKTATLGQVSVGPKRHLWFSACKTACLASELLVSVGPRPSSVIFSMHITACFWTRMNKSVLVPHLICVFFSFTTAWLCTRLTRLYGFQTSSVVLCIHITACLMTTINRLSIGSSPHLWFCTCKTPCL